MERVCGVVPSPIETTIIVPNWEDIFFSCDNRFNLLAIYLLEDSLKVLSWVGISCNHLVAFLLRELGHNRLDHLVGVVVELLEIVTEVSQDMTTVEYLFEKDVFPFEILDKRLFGTTHITVSIF